MKHAYGEAIGQAQYHLSVTLLLTVKVTAEVNPVKKHA
jgi:hypothetical protein